MKRLLTILLTLVTLSAFAQIQPAPPTGSKAYGTTTYISPDGLLWYGTNPLKYRGVYPKTKIDSLLALIPVVDTSLYYTKTASDARFVSLTGSYANPSFITSLDYAKITGAPTALTFANGLRSQSGVVKLGLDLTTVGSTNLGSLTENTYLTYGDIATSNFRGLIVTDALTSLITTTDANNSNGIIASTTDLTFRRNAGGSNQDLVFSSLGMVVTDNIGSKGLSYNANYAAANVSNPRWIVDKGYVDNAITNAPAKTLQQVLTAGNTANIEAIIDDGTATSIMYPGVFETYNPTSTKYLSVRADASSSELQYSGGGFGKEGGMRFVHSGANYTVELGKNYTSAGDFIGLTWSTLDSLYITDEKNDKGLSYAANYDTKGLLDPNWIPSLRAVKGLISASTGTLTSVTAASGANVTPSALQVTDVTNLNSAIQSSVLYNYGASANAGGFGVTDGTGLKRVIEYSAVTGQTAIYNDLESSSILLREETGSNSGILISTRMSGSPAINSTDFITLGQLSNYVNTTGNQTGIAGTKEWTGNQTYPGFISSIWSGGGVSTTVYPAQIQVTGTSSQALSLDPNSISFFTGVGVGGTLRGPASGSGNSWYLPNSGGTIALTSNLAGYVTIATSQTVTANKDFSGNINFYGTTFDVDNDNISLAKINVNGRGGGSPLKPFMIMNPAGTTNVSPTSTDIPAGFDAYALYGKRIADGTSHLSWKVRKVGSTDLADYGGSLLQPTLTADREWTMPDATGAVALVPEITVTSAGTYAIPTTKSSYNTFTGTTSTWTLPPIAGTSGMRIVVISRGSGDITLNSNAGGNDIDESGVNSASIAVPTATTLILVNNSLKWVIVN